MSVYLLTDTPIHIVLLPTTQTILELLQQQYLQDSTENDLFQVYLELYMWTFLDKCCAINYTDYV